MNRFVLGLATFALLLVFSGCTESALVGSDEEATVSSDQKTVLVDVFAAKHDKGKGKSKDKKPDSPPDNPDPPVNLMIRVIQANQKRSKSATSTSKV